MQEKVMLDKELFNNNQQEKWRSEDEYIQSAKENIKKILDEAFNKKSPIDEKQIDNIRNELSNLKGLVTNFDETFIKEKSFTEILDILTKEPEAFNSEDVSYEEFYNNAVYFRKFIANLKGKEEYKDFNNNKYSLTSQDKEELARDKDKTPIQIFYEKSLRG